VAGLHLNSEGHVLGSGATGQLRVAVKQKDHLCHVHSGLTEPQAEVVRDGAQPSLRVEMPPYPQARPHIRTPAEFPFCHAGRRKMEVGGRSLHFLKKSLHEEATSPTSNMAATSWKVWLLCGLVF
jgi:hypothetical protein